MFKMASNSTGFRAKVFDPLLIIAQIIALQVFFYMSLGLWVIFADVIAKITPSFSQLFSYKVSGYSYKRKTDSFMMESENVVFRSLDFLTEAGL